MATTLTVEQIRQVLTLVKDQPGFRADLTLDPSAALAGIGISSDGDDIPLPPERVTLPSDEAIQDRLDEITDQVMAKIGVIRQLLQLDSD